MDVIVFASQKGGAGKTTLAGHLGVQADLAKDGPVAWLDLDPQSSLADWWNERSKDRSEPALANLGQGGLPATLDALRKAGIKLAIIDTPGRADASVAKIIQSANLVIVPVKPSPHDLRAVEQTLDMIEEERVPLVFVVNDAGSGNLTKEAAIALSQHGKLAPVICRSRQDYRASMVKGLTVMEMNTRTPSKSVDEIAGLWTYIKGELKKGKRHGR